MGIYFFKRFQNLCHQTYLNTVFVFSCAYRALVASSVAAPHISKIVASLTSALSSLYDPQRVVVAAFFAEVRYFCLYLLSIILQLVAYYIILWRSENTFVPVNNMFVLGIPVAIIYFLWKAENIFVSVYNMFVNVYFGTFLFECQFW